MKKSERLQMIKEICLARREAMQLELTVTMPSDDALQELDLMEWLFTDDEMESYRYEPIRA